MDAGAALRTFEAANAVQTTSDPALSLESFRRDLESNDAIFRFDNAAQNAILNEKPWKADLNYFKTVKISAVALVKMVMHARSGGNLEVMGLMQGKVIGNTMVVMDAFALPVEGTETRVNAQAQANEYMVQYLDLIKRVGRLENAIGWYHSHPGYGCWLSGIDVTTQMTNQQFQEPFLAVVIDPMRTISAGRVEVGAFRTYPEGKAPQDDGPQEYQTIPIDKIGDFGMHVKQYYPLEISYFKSSTDSALLNLLWNKYWVNTLSSNPLLANRDYISQQVEDIAKKLEQNEGQFYGGGGRGGGSFYPGSEEKRKERSALTKVTRDCCKTSQDVLHGLLAQHVKASVFHGALPAVANAGALAGPSS